jgi:hypothetical protein
MGIRIATDFVKIAHEWKIPGLQDCYLDRVAPNLAARESRRIIGDYVLTAQDMYEGKAFDDAVAFAWEQRLDTVYFHGKAAGRMGVPYRCFLPKGIEGLLVAGRCFSIEHEALGGARSMGTVMAYGEAAGTAAALATAQGILPRRVAAKEIRARLVETGTVWPENSK